MYAVKNGFVIHINGTAAQKYIDEGGYEFLDDDENPIPDDELQDYIQKDIEAHRGVAHSYEELIEQLKAQGINLKGE